MIKDNFLIRINDSSKDEILTQVTGNCSNPSLQDSYFNQKDIYNKKDFSYKRRSITKRQK